MLNIYCFGCSTTRPLIDPVLKVCLACGCTPELSKWDEVDEVWVPYYGFDTMDVVRQQSKRK